MTHFHTHPTTERLPQRRGSALVTVLWVMAVLSILATSVNFTVNLELRVGKHFLDEMRTSCLAQAGVAAAMAVLAEDETESDGLEDKWHNNEDAFAEVELGRGEFSVIRHSTDPLEPVAFGMIDEESKLNVNTATRDMLMALPGIDDEIADCILDWRDYDSIAERFGAEHTYYVGRPRPYPCKDAPFTSLRELLLVRGVTPHDLFGEDTNDNAWLDSNECDGNDRPPEDDHDSVIDRGFAQFLTPYSFEWNRDAEGQPRVDLNVASETQLADIDGISQEAAKAIVAHREKNDFENVGQLLDVKKPKEEPKKDDKAARTKPGRGRARPGTPKEAPKPAAPKKEETKKSDDKPVFKTDQLKQFVDRLTVHHGDTLQGRVNVNTAAKEVLSAVPGIGDNLAEKLIALRKTSPLKHLGQLFDVDGMTPDTFKEICGHLCVRSTHFRIRAIGRLPNSRVQRQVSCVVRRNLDQLDIVYWSEDGGR